MEFNVKVSELDVNSLNALKEKRLKKLKELKNSGVSKEDCRKFPHSYPQIFLDTHYDRL